MDDNPPANRSTTDRRRSDYLTRTACEWPRCTGPRADESFVASSIHTSRISQQRFVADETFECLDAERFAFRDRKAKKLGLEKGVTLVAKVRGDGREYSLNLYLNKPLVAFAYRATVSTKKDEWIEVNIPLDKFEASWFGKAVPTAGQVDPKEVNALGFLLGDKKAGPFRMEIEWVKVVRAVAK
ncbi:MAG: CIA30 family protein [Planctomycetota bacterium]